jgi:hypothetical protein
MNIDAYNIYALIPSSEIFGYAFSKSEIVYPFPNFSRIRSTGIRVFFMQGLPNIIFGSKKYVNASPY